MKFISMTLDHGKQQEQSDLIADSQKYKLFDMHLESRIPQKGENQ